MVLSGLWDFGPDAVTLTLRDLVEEMRISFPENPLPAWSFWLSQRQSF